MVRALREVVDDARTRVLLDDGDVVLDIGANDGTLLRLYPDGVRRVAYEPAENLWPLLRGHAWDSPDGIAAIYGYFPTILNGEPVGMEQPAKIITSVACFYDVEDPNQFVEGIKRSLAPDGVWINQLAYLPDTLATNNFGDIVHEHLTYWTIASFNALLQRHGLMLEDWSHNDVNGGSVRFIVRHADGRESKAAVYSDNFGMLALKRFAQRISLQRAEVRNFLQAAKHAGQLVVGYGASTKGNTYMQYWGIGPDLVEFVADRNPDKHGKYTPTGQRVISEEEARAMRPAYFLALPFHFIEAFIEREQDFLESGGQFVVPFPSLHFAKGGDPGSHILQEATVSDNRAAV